MDKLFEFSVSGDCFSIYGERPSEDIFSPINVTVFKNGKKCSEFGETEFGRPFKAIDAFKSVLVAYINENADFNFLFVCDKIKDYKAKFTTCEKETPKFIITSLKEVCELVAISDIRNYYVGADELFVVTNKQNCIETDIDAFAISAFETDYNEGKILVVYPKATHLLQFINK